MRQKVKGEKMVHFIGAGPGDPELLTIKGKKLIDQADVIIYAGSLVNKEVLAGAKEGAEIYNKAPYDPESVASAGNYFQGIDNFMMPSLRNFGFNVNFNF